MLRSFSVTLLSLLCVAPLFALELRAQDYKAEKLAEAAPADAVSPEIAAVLQPTGFKVARGERSVCEIWLAKEWPIKAAKNNSGEVLYPFQPGQIIGVARYARKGSDFRDQDIPAGVYVLRYSQQPVDGAHVGTSPTRDFLCLLPAAKDRKAAILDYKALTTSSKETTGSNHPAILSLQRLPEAAADPLSMRHDEEKDWQIVRFVGKTVLNKETSDQVVEMVVVGVAAE